VIFERPISRLGSERRGAVVYRATPRIVGQRSPVLGLGLGSDGRRQRRSPSSAPCLKDATLLTSNSGGLSGKVCADTNKKPQMVSTVERRTSGADVRAPDEQCAL
jgi:hypothetical protein